MTRGLLTGFTFFECLLTLCLISSLVTLAIPSFQHFLVSLETESELFALLNGLYYAKQEAVRRNAPVTFCQKQNCSGSWDSGWIIFVDSNKNRKQDPNETLIYSRGALASGSQLKWKGTTSNPDNIQFKPNGFIFGLGNGSFCYFPPKHSQQEGQRIAINREGRVRLDRATKEDCT